MYEKFKEIDGRHPWRNVSPDGYVDYQARYRPHGRVLYFNFPLAKEMGLIPSDHPSSINKDLEQVILDTFSLQIINEYDLEQGKKFPPETIKPHPYMATRYLQTQHRNQTRQDFRRRPQHLEWLHKERQADLRHLESRHGRHDPQSRRAGSSKTLSDRR